MGKTSIEWTDASWNPIVGCTEVSPGCANCYAARLAATRLRNTPQYKGLSILRNGRLEDAACAAGILNVRPHWTGEVRFLPERLEEPLHWKKPRRIFVCDMGDLFHESVVWHHLARIFGIIARCPHHTFQILTKRAARMKRFFDETEPRLTAGIPQDNWPLPNVWLGVSVENQHFADERIPLLLDTPAAVRFVSAEPLLGPVNLHFNWLRSGLGWLICGGESGPNARPMHPAWARSLRDQCQAASVPFFFKQWGEWLPAGQQQSTGKDGGPLVNVRDDLKPARLGKRLAGRLLDGREWNEFPGGPQP